MILCEVEQFSYSSQCAKKSEHGVSQNLFSRIRHHTFERQFVKPFYHWPKWSVTLSRSLFLLSPTMSAMCRNVFLQISRLLVHQPGKLVVDLVVKNLGMTVLNTAMGVVVAGTNEKMSLFMSLQ
jgi:hypothetical protein